MGNSAWEIALSDAGRGRLERVRDNPKTLQKRAGRARIVLELGSGCGATEALRRTGRSKPTVRRWRKRSLDEGVDGPLHDTTRPRGRSRCPKTRQRP